MLKSRTIAGFMFLAAASSAQAALHDQPFDYRLSLTLDRLQNFTDVIGRGNASAAHPLGSSVNPASGDFLQDPPFDFHLVGTATVNYIMASAGTEVLGKSTTGVIRFPHAGTITMTVARTDTLNGSSNTPASYDISSTEGQIGYSLKINPDWSVGIGLHIIDASLGITTNQSPGLLDRQTDSLGFNPSIGTLLNLDKHWAVGIVGGGGTTHSKTNVTVFDPRVAPVPFMVGSTSDTLSWDVHAGLAYHPVDTLGIYLDGQWRRLSSPLGTLDDGRCFLGAEWFTQPWLALRSGASIDTFGKASASCGLGFYAIKHTAIELGYSYNTFPEVREEFGIAHVFSLSFIVSF